MMLPASAVEGLAGEIAVSDVKEVLRAFAVAFGKSFDEASGIKDDEAPRIRTAVAMLDSTANMRSLLASLQPVVDEAKDRSLHCIAGRVSGRSRGSDCQRGMARCGGNVPLCVWCVCVH